MTLPERAPSATLERPKRSFIGRLVRLALVAILIVVVLFAVGVLNNNYSLHRASQAEFTAQMDRAIDSATTWIVQQPDIQGNPPLMFMIGDMAQMSGDPRLRSYIQTYLASPRVRQPGMPATWYHAHWVDPSCPCRWCLRPMSQAWGGRTVGSCTQPHRTACLCPQSPALISSRQQSTVGEHGRTCS